jgi:hypothetical protein
MLLTVRGIGKAAGGITIALGVLELGLRFLATRDPMPRPRILADSLDAPSVTSRQIDESVAIAHYSVAGARLTGNPPIDGAPTIVILGDSYVAAREVFDGETMGAELERIARGQGVAINARQYGWIGASPGRYVLAAPEVLSRWDPVRVVIPMAGNDLDLNAAELDPPRVRVDTTGSLRIVGPAADPGVGRGPHSALLMLARRRWTLLRQRAPSWARPVAFGIHAARVETAPQETLPARPDDAELAALPAAVVGALGKAYGRKAILIYLAEVGITGGELPSPLETGFIEGCRIHSVVCLSTRELMLEARRRGIVARGSPTTRLGYGHLNAAGHALIGRAIWDLHRTAPAGR